MSTQLDEIKTICGRSFTLNLSSADVERIFQKAGSVGMTPSELLQYFIGDLVNGTYTNGSDERMYANNWFDRCGFSMVFGEISFLQWLLRSSDVEAVVDAWYLLQDYKEDQDELDEDDNEYVKDIERELNEAFEEYQASKYAIKDSTLESEMLKVIKWHNEKCIASAEPACDEPEHEEDEYEM